MWKANLIVRISGYIPVIMLAAVLCCAVFKLDNSTLAKLAVDFGNSTLSLLFLLLIVIYSRLKYCLIAKISVLGLCANHLLYKVGAYINYETYSEIYTISACGSVLPIWLLLLYLKKKEVCGASS